MDITKIPEDSTVVRDIVDSVQKADHDMVIKEALLKSLDEDNRSVKFVASTEAMDADGDVVEQIWDLKRFKSNPVILFGHNSSDLPIGQAITAGLNDEGSLEIDVKFASAAANPKAEQVYQLVKERVLRAVSVGFRPKEVRRERRDDKDVFILSQNELMELSVVPIPSNPEALAKMKQKAISAQLSVEPKTPAESGKETLKMDLEKQLSEANGKLESVTKAKDALEARCSDLEESNKALTQDLNALQSERIDKELQALTGVKIAPSEVETLKELAKLDHDLYARQLKAIESRPSMPVSKKNVLGDDNVEREPVVIDENGQSLDRLLS